MSSRTEREADQGARLEEQERRTEHKEVRAEPADRGPAAARGAEHPEERDEQREGERRPGSAAR
jgi:hypothetical protein